MISRFALDPESLESFPKDLLDGSRESVRMAERILREIGVEAGRAPLVVLSERLARALEAMEEVEVDETPDPVRAAFPASGRDDMPIGPYVGVRPGFRRR